MNNTKEMGVIEKNSNTKVVFSLTEFKGRIYIDVREHIDTETYSGPTKKGLRLDTEFFDDFLKIVKAMEKEIKKGK
jgi:hypothetical protein